VGFRNEFLNRFFTSNKKEEEAMPELNIGIIYWINT